MPLVVRLHCRLGRRRREQQGYFVDDVALGDGHAFPPVAPAADAAAQPGAVVPRVRFRSLELMDPLLCNTEMARGIGSLLRMCHHGLLLLLTNGRRTGPLRGTG